MTKELANSGRHFACDRSGAQRLRYGYCLPELGLNFLLQREMRVVKRTASLHGRINILAGAERPLTGRGVVFAGKSA